MIFPRSSAELIKNTSVISPTTLPTVKDALDNLSGRTPTSLPVPITEGGTGQTTKTAAFNALSPQTTRGDLITRDATNDIRLPLGAAGTLLRSDGTDAVYSTFTAYLDAIFTGEANGDLIQRTAGTWTNVTVPTMLATLLTAQGQIIRHGASAPEAYQANAANTFLGGNGTTVESRTASQVLASLGIENGTFTPDMAFATPGTSSFSYSAQQGEYLKVGSWYFVTIQLVVTPTVGTGSGDVRIGGLPANASRNSTGSISEAGGANLTWTASRTQLGFRLVQSADYGIITQMGSAQSQAVIQASHLTSGAAHTFRFAAGYSS